MVLTTVDQAVFRSQSPTPGPVHLNCPFREPLTPLQPEERDWDAYLSSIVSWQNHLQPYTTHFTAPLSPSEVMIDELAERFHQAQKGLIMVGQLDSPETADAVVRMADELRWPLAADVGSGLRLERRTDRLIPYFDLLLLSETLRQEVAPDVILLLGKRVVSKRFLQMLARHHGIELIHVAPFSARLDPEHRVNHRILADVAEFCRALTGAVKPTRNEAYWTELQLRSDRIARALQQEFRDEQPVSEQGVLRRLSQALPESAGLFLANSMPIRDMDMFGDAAARDVRIAVNRGASGIDGNLATACGFAHGLGRLTTAVLGDLALIHDLNSLWLLKNSPVPLVLIVLNNQGGGIFSFLPVHAVREHFERFFGTPHDLTFGRIAEAFGLTYAQPATLGEFTAAYARAVATARSALIEIRTNREANHELHEQVQQRIIAALEEAA
ncbi:MAG: 2-succinyl-5-enolpyruvyl-6-hydroxy-3-cyclohexene-1-carboxylic-acid synthase [candidate division KSB1 bacterium]|nr:2-succinyl-5-enolpyruvyl-6-hydroxy-3-cyclohexene-1-carboxylic-acid synthase [candidate division KSB1 bacterium]